LTLSPDIRLPSHDGGTSESAFIKALRDVGDAQDGQDAVVSDTVSSDHTPFQDFVAQSAVLGWADRNIWVYIARSFRVDDMSLRVGVVMIWHALGMGGNIFNVLWV
jgi:hypothetical protein